MKDKATVAEGREFRPDIGPVEFAYNAVGGTLPAAITVTRVHGENAYRMRMDMEVGDEYLASLVSGESQTPFFGWLIAAAEAHFNKAWRALQKKQRDAWEAEKARRLAAKHGLSIVEEPGRLTLADSDGWLSRPQDN